MDALLKLCFSTVISASLLTGCTGSPAAAALPASVAPTATASAPAAAPVPWQLSDAKLKELQDLYAEDKAINADVQCVLYFESGLITDPVLRGTDNDHYLYVNWETGESQTYGSLAMDYRNDLSTDQQNTLIYGHYIYKNRNSNRTLVFTPLAQLIHEENYEANKYVSIVTSTEVRYYVIARVFSCPLETEFGTDYPIKGMDYNYLSYEDDYFSSYLDLIQEHEWYSTDVELTNQD
ncbi:MAG: class B sortase, partial [Erysipelotrichia bacterium]|nr:class B sortase [Erysipelotrichia bacterium]